MIRSTFAGLNSGQPDAGVYSASGTNKPDETHFTNRFV